MFHRKFNTTGERRAKSGERADHGRAPPSKGRRRRPPDAWDLEPQNARILRAWKVARRMARAALKRGQTRQQTWDKLQAKREFACLPREWFDLLWRWETEDRLNEKRRGV